LKIKNLQIVAWVLSCQAKHTGVDRLTHRSLSPAFPCIRDFLRLVFLRLVFLRLVFLCLVQP
jgi:hypothetical protein